MTEEQKVDSFLAPFRVLDLTDEKGFLCGKILGDLGADVIKIEKPGGDPARRVGPFYHDVPDPERSLYWLAFNMNKRGITLDIETADGREIFEKLVRSADLVVESFPPGYLEQIGLNYPALSRINPRIIMTSITPFGQTGPYKDYKGSDIVAMAMSGMMYANGDPDRAPVRISFPQAFLHAGVEAAVGSLTAFYHRQMTGEGQHVDVSIQATMVSATNNIQQYWTMNRAIVRRGGPGRVMPVTGVAQRLIRKCADGHVTFQLMGGTLGAPTMRALISWMDEKGMAPEGTKQVNWEKFDWASLDTAAREMLDRLYEAMDRFFLLHTKQEILVEGVKRRILMYPVCTAGDILQNPQLQAREFWEEIEHPELGAAITYPGAFFKATETPWRVWRRAPLIGEHNGEMYEKELGFFQEDPVTLKQGDSCPIPSRSSRPPLKRDVVRQGVFEGVRVADFTVGAVGPLATKYLAEHGATVLHIESETAVEICRAGPPFKDGIPGPNRSAWMPNFNSSKYGITLNLRHPRGKEVAKRIVAWADVVVNNMPAGTMERWGLGYEDIKEANPGIIVAVSSMQGHTGPYRTHAGYGTQLAALSGFTHLTGWPDRDPSEIWMAYTDFVGPRFVGATLIAALDHRRRTGKGQFLDFSQLEMGLQFIAPLLLDYTVNGRVAERMGNRSANAAPHGAYRCRGEDRWCAIAVASDDEWEGLCRAIGDVEWTKDTRFSTLLGRLENENELDRLLEERTIKFTAEDLMALLQAAGVSAGVVETGEDLHDDPQLKHRGYFQIMNHSEIGPLAHSGLGFILSKTLGGGRWAGPCLGEHNEQVYTKILGMSEEEFVELLVDGALE